MLFSLSNKQNCRNLPEEAAGQFQQGEMRGRGAKKTQGIFSLFFFLVGGFSFTPDTHSYCSQIKQNHAIIVGSSKLF